MDATTEVDDDAFTAPPWGELGRSATLGLVSGLSKFLLHVLNRTAVNNAEAWDAAVLHRPQGKGLITVCNHTSTIDDPVVISAITPWTYFWTEHQHKGNRWSLCAREICYKYYLLGEFFRSGKTLPIERGGGPQQPVMHTAAQRVAGGDWVHIFPEGKVGYAGRLAACKWGLGALLCDCVRSNPSAAPPGILPFYHSGMGEVMPKHGRVPRAGRTVTVTIGDPIDVSDLTPRCLSSNDDQQLVWRDITERVAAALKALEATSPPNVDQTRGQGADREATLKERDPSLPDASPAA